MVWCFLDNAMIRDRVDLKNGHRRRKHKAWNVTPLALMGIIR